MGISDEFEQMLVAYGNARQEENDPNSDDTRACVFVCDQSQNGYYVIFGDDYRSEMAMEDIQNDELFGFMWKKLTSLAVS